MPNWCMDHLEASGPVEVMTKFIEALKPTDKDGNKKFSFTGIAPRPADQEENWYQWDCDNWGTKWDASDIELHIDSDNKFLYCNFSTAWSPPILWFEKASEMFPELKMKLEFEEGGMDFYGEATASGGDVEVRDMSHYEWLLENNDDFQGAIDWVKTADYDELKEEFTEGQYAADEYEEFKRHLEPLFIKRIPENELPLFITHEWSSEEINKIFCDRVTQ